MNYAASDSFSVFPLKVQLSFFSKSLEAPNRRAGRSRKDFYSLHMSYAAENPALWLSACSGQQGLREQQAMQTRGMYLFIAGESPPRGHRTPLCWPQLPGLAMVRAGAGCNAKIWRSVSFTLKDTTLHNLNYTWVSFNQLQKSGYL